MHTRLLSNTVRRWLPIALAATSLAMAGPSAWAQSYPDKPIRLIVPFPPGGSIDVVARLLGKKLSDALGQTVVVDNRAGANGSIGSDMVAKAPADGYTLLLADRGAFGINPSLYKKLPYDPLKDFDYVGIAVWAPYVLVAHAAVPVKDVPELVALARKDRCKLNYASFGIGSMAQMGMEAFNAQYGVCMTHVPYKGGGPAVAAALSGEVDVTIATIGPALPHIRQGKLTALAVGSATRSALLPQTPAITEVGGSADTMPRTYFGFALPAGSPPAVRKRLSDALQRIVAMPEVKDQLAQSGLETAEVSSEQMARTVQTDVPFFARLAAQIGIKPE